MELAEFDAPVSTLNTFGRSAGTRLAYVVESGKGPGLFAAKWQFNSLHVVTANLPHDILACRTAGTATITRVANGTCVRKRPALGSAIFTSADTASEWSMDGSCEALHVYISQATVQSFTEEHLATPAVPRITNFFAVEDPWLKGYFQMLISECEIFADSSKPADPLFLGQTEHLLLRHLLRWHSDAGEKDLKALDLQCKVNPLRQIVMRRVEEYIEAKLAGDIRLHDLAGQACMSVDHFVRAFRAASGTTPYHYVLEQRLRKACTMLRNSAEPVARIAMECGFKSTSHFSAKFHSHFGMSPSKYRRPLQA